MSYVLAFVGFSMLIILHEAGHFAAAKKVGMRVERFSLFFGRPLWSMRRGETEYGIGWIPAGGFVKISGMNPHEELPEEVQHRAYYRQPVWKRLVVIAAGPIVNLILAFLIFFVFYWANGIADRSRTEVAQVNPGSPAAGVLQPGDELLAVDGKRGEFATLAKQIGTHKCAGTPVDGCEAATPAVLTVVRDGREQTLEVRPRYEADEDPPRTLVGFSATSPDKALGPGGSASQSLDTMWTVTSETVKVVGRLFYSAEARNEVSGVVGSYETTRRSFQVDWEQAILILGLISLSLAVINLLPLLPLDGGHIFWALAEKVRGRAIPFGIMERASVVGFVLILLLFFIGLENDVDRLRDGGFDIPQ
ncbi:MAG TPA: site-2 protease family protein [Solirubrobacteraceae bacterium]|nr:site-2 protease family protein [Solirubrobacteraceae bacterium]